MATLTPVRTVGIWEIGSHSSGGWRQWYVRNVNSDSVGLVDFDDATEAGLPDNLHKFSSADVQTMRAIIWQFN